MKIRMVAAMVLSMWCAGAVTAATPQQEKMKACNVEAAAKSLKGDDRKKFMRECLSAASDGVKSGLTAQQGKMKTCNAEAKTRALSGGDRKKFMSECLSN
jgi:folate-binding Fe-S cluster repair protein YgfZ